MESVVGVRIKRIRKSISKSENEIERDRLKPIIFI